MTPRASTKTSTLGGQDKGKRTSSNLTGQTGSSSGLTDPQGGLTGAQTGLTSVSSKSGNSSTVGTRKKPSFKELLAKYEKEGAVQKQKEWPDKAKGSKSTSISSEQSDSRLRQGNCVVMPNSELIAPWFWSYPCYYTLLDYSIMYMQIYYIQYPSMYPNCIPQRPISNNLVKKDLNCSKEGEKNVKKDSKYLQPRWCPSGLSHTQKRRLQRLRNQEKMEQQVEVEPTKPIAMKKVWRPKQIVSSSTWRKARCGR